ncbi:hypothetical protein NPIL_156111 [Nephila pilipes]|uniref:Uncharacterized protein n=1 Tax=Nephila pilipes TaxID=299642 RepID=A0A8X6NNQ7_NEPPI|nr:hypothetical protein NPIL_156111 [Nephila pilipes]
MNDSEQEIEPLDLSKRPAVSDVPEIPGEADLEDEYYMSVFDSESETAKSMPKIEGVDHVYSNITRCLMLDTLILSDIPQQIRLHLRNMNFEQILAVSQMMSNLVTKFFYLYFEKILETNQEKLNGLCEMECAEFFLSRCVTLCGEPTFLNFMFVASFLSYLVFTCYNKHGCFRILYIVEFCFAVLYKRIFREVFKETFDYMRLVVFCEEFNENMEEEYDMSDEINCINGIIEKGDIIGDSFYLNESERVLFQNFYAIESTLPISSELEKKIINILESEPFRFHHGLSCGFKCYSYLDFAKYFS